MYNEIYYGAWGVKIGTAKTVLKNYDIKDTVYTEDMNPVLVEELRDNLQKEEEEKLAPRPKVVKTGPMNLLKDHRIQVFVKAGHDETYCYQPQELEKISIDFSKKKLRGSCMITYGNMVDGKFKSWQDKPHKEVVWFDLSHPLLDIRIEKI